MNSKNEKKPIPDFVNDAELVIGVVGKIGTDTKAVFRWVKTALQNLNYDLRLIKLTQHIKETTFSTEIVETPVEKKYDTYIEACNNMRKLAQRNDLFAHIACEYIRTERKRINETGDPQDAAARKAYLIDQIKRPEEAEKLREIYGDQFILISCHIGKEESVDSLARRIARSHPEAPRYGKWLSAGAELFDKDQMEEDQEHGQRVRNVFHLADLVIDGRDKSKSEALLNRFFRALFGDYTVSPTREEFFQNIAQNIALTSCDLARQVGAVIEFAGEIAATGFNEAPRAGGGTYWATEGYDARDAVLGEDINTIRKRQMVMDIVVRLKNIGDLKPDLCSLDNTKLEEIYLKREDENIKSPLEDSQIMDTLEYGRSVHAEMAAIAAAARLGRSIERGTLYCTTFPCHNCAKHIVVSGITKVVYLEPYPKSFVMDLYPDSISIDNRNPDEYHVLFEQFTGITPWRYNKLFAKEKFKDEKR